ncbi:MAG: hypothetical protein JNJ82_04200 [Opitutaceae bacterium]|nr:hypothetical protein [Opitutaceae bacterium]
MARGMGVWFLAGVAWLMGLGVGDRALAAPTPTPVPAAAVASATSPSTSVPEPAAGPSVVLIIGAPGESEYETALQLQRDRWTTAVQRAGGSLTVIGGAPVTTEGTEFDRVQRVLAEQTQASAGASPLWVVLAGHGSFDGKEAKFNLRGPDFTADQLATWLNPALRPVAVIVATSGSAPFLAKLTRPGRVIVVATRSGYELNYARFGSFFAESVADPAADLDQDGQTSLLESFLQAAHRTAEYYRNEGRLLSEHALIDDTGDGLGTPAEWFRGVRATKRAKDGAALDGLRAHQWHLVPSGPERLLTSAQRERRDALEQEIERLRQKKGALETPEYERQLEALLLEVARMYEGLPPAGSE